jgi:hypothetical protein
MMRRVGLAVPWLLAVGCHLIGGAGQFTIRDEGAGGGTGGASEGGAAASCESGVDCPLGTPCSDASICASGFCVDDVCCGEICTGDCVACDQPGHEGSCRPHVAGSDPDGDCTAGICDGAGVCATGAYRWLVTFGNGSQNLFVTGAESDAGQVYVTGRFRDPVDFGGGLVPSAAGKHDAFVAKYDDRGALSWVRPIGNGAHDQHAQAIARRVGGGVVVAGRFKEAIDFGDGELVDSIAGKYDIFVAAYDGEGELSWLQTIGNGVHDQFAEGVAVDGDGNVAVVGRFKAAVDFGGGLVASMDSSKYDGFLAAFDSLGNFHFAVTLGNGSHDQYVDGVASDLDGNVTVVGRFKGEVDFGGGPVPSAGAFYDAFAASYDGSGQLRWVRGIGQGAHDQYATAITTGADGSVLIGGRLKGVVDLGGGETIPLGDRYDGFVAKYESTGGFGWARLIGSGLADQQVLAVTASEPGGVIVAGAFLGVVDVGGETLESAGAMPDAFVARYAAEGAVLWARGYGNGTADQRGTAVATSGGSIFLAGEFQGIVDFGGGAVSSAGARDEGFVLTLAP